MQNKGGHWSSKISVFSSIFKHDFHQSFIHKRPKNAFHWNTYIRNIFQQPPFPGSWLNIADILFTVYLVSDAKYGQKEHCNDQELNIVLFNHYSFTITYWQLLQHKDSKNPHTRSYSCFEVWQSKFLQASWYSYWQFRLSNLIFN